jgi:hypothetical protein
MRWMKLEQVVCRSEGRADQRPRKLRLNGCWFEVTGVVEEWLERQADPASPTWRVFRVNCPLGRCLLRTMPESWFWELALEEKPREG